MKKLVVSLLIMMAGHVVQMTADINADVTLTPAGCNGVSTNIILVNNISGGVAPYTVSVVKTTDSVGLVQKGALAQTSFIFKIQQGDQRKAHATFTITVTDSAATAPFVYMQTLTQQTTFFLYDPVVVNVSCPGGHNGEIDLGGTVIGGHPVLPLSYSLMSVATGKIVTGPSPLFIGLPAGLYEARVGDADGNCAIGLALVTEPAVSTNPIIAYIQSKYCTSCITVPAT